jgi:aspartyl-tRNA(Asn)/glutamyl-tRNA(Gln) amidotransferase subunit C
VLAGRSKGVGAAPEKHFPERSGSRRRRNPSNYNVANARESVFQEPRNDLQPSSATRFALVLRAMTDIDLTHLCQLAQLALDEAEQQAVRGDLARIIDMVDQMQSVATDDVEPLAHPLGSTARLRADDVTETVDRERFQALAPAVQDGFYLVPRVVE